MPELIIKVQNKIAKPLNDFIVCNNSDILLNFILIKNGIVS